MCLPEEGSLETGKREISPLSERTQEHVRLLNSTYRANQTEEMEKVSQKDPVSYMAAGTSAPTYPRRTRSNIKGGGDLQRKRFIDATYFSSRLLRG